MFHISLPLQVAAAGGGADFAYTASGGLTTGGAAAIQRRFAHVATGGLVTGGAAGISTTVAPPVGGDLVTGGAAVITRGYLHTATGGLVLGGAAQRTTSWSFTASGGLVTGGAAGATNGKVFEVAGDGGVVTGGEAEAGRIYSYVAQPPVQPDPGPGPVEIVRQDTGGGYFEVPVATLVYVGGGRVRTGGQAEASATIREPARVLRLEAGPRMRLRGSANAYALPRPRRNRDLEDLALANMARTAR